MAEIKLTPKQKANIGKLLKTAAKDKDLQGQLVADPAAVFAEYDLENLVKGREVHVGFDITASHDEVKLGGVNAILGWHIDANTGHADAHLHQDVSRAHADTNNNHADTPSGHFDWSHQDLPALHLDL